MWPQKNKLDTVTVVWCGVWCGVKLRIYTPLVDASSATPTPVAPPPITNTSYSSPDCSNVNCSSLHMHTRTTSQWTHTRISTSRGLHKVLEDSRCWVHRLMHIGHIQMCKHHFLRVPSPYGAHTPQQRMNPPKLHGTGTHARHAFAPCHLATHRPGWNMDRAGFFVRACVGMWRCSCPLEWAHTWS